MRKLRCYNCKRSFLEDEADTRSECVGEFWGSPAYMDYNVCPFCGSDELDEDEGGEEDDEP